MYKYCIKEKMHQLTVAELRRLRKEIPLALGKTTRTFDRYCTITVDDNADIPALDLDIIASFLSCSADDLKNYVVDNCNRKKRKIRTKHHVAQQL